MPEGRSWAELRIPEDALTQLLRAWAEGSADAADGVLERIHHELVGVARRAMLGERRDHTLQPTALVHEAFLRLAGKRISWQDRRHFFAVAATLMRRILVDHARAALRDKRGAGAARVELREDDRVDSGPEVDLLDLDIAMKRLAVRSPEAGLMVELCYFGGLSYEEIAETLGVSRATVGRELRFARVWLRHQMTAEG